MSESTYRIVCAVLLGSLGLVAFWFSARNKLAARLREIEADFRKNLALGEFERGLEAARDAGDRIHRNGLVHHLRYLQRADFPDPVRRLGTTLERLHWACDEGCDIDHVAQPVAMNCVCDVLRGSATAGYECPVHPKDPGAVQS